VLETRAHCDALQPAHHTAHKSLHHISAVCYRLQHSTRLGICLIHPGWRPASPEGQPLRQVNNQRSKHQTTTAAMPNQCKPDTQTQSRFMHSPAPTRIWKVIEPTKEKPALLAHRTGTAARKARQPNRFRFFPLPSLPYWLKPHFYQTLFYHSPLRRINSFGTHTP
jgi:hypothetical protein